MTPGQALKELVTLANRPQGIVWRQLQPHHRQQVALLRLSSLFLLCFVTDVC